MQQKGVPSKTPAKSKAAAENKKGAVKGLEEITDSRPRTIKYTRDFFEETNGEGLEITEEVAVKLAAAFLKLEVIETNRETLEETKLDEVRLDLSSMLYPSDKVSVSKQTIH